jgi:hypothetical protein
MKKKNLLFSVVLFFSILPMAFFTSCDKDTNCYLDVKVLDEGMINPISGEMTPGNPIPLAEVEVYQDGGTVYSKGITGSDGVYSTYFNAPAIVKIKARLQLYNDAGQAAGERRGETSVRLAEGETITANVTLSSQVYY